MVNFVVFGGEKTKPICRALAGNTKIDNSGALSG
jgi:hypothetical protein